MEGWTGRMKFPLFRSIRRDDVLISIAQAGKRNFVDFGSFLGSMVSVNDSRD